MREIAANEDLSARFSALTAPNAAMLAVAGAMLALIGAALFPPAAYSIDEAVYIDMAQAFAERGAFDVTPQNLPSGAPVMAKSDHLVHIQGERAIPQYPALYGVIAAPFFWALGVKGLFFLNALSGVFSLWMTHRIAHQLTKDEWVARASVLILGAASIFAGYVFAIWPHMLALAFVMGGAQRNALRAGETIRTAYAALWAGTGAGLDLRGRGRRADRRYSRRCRWLFSG